MLFLNKRILCHVSHCRFFVFKLEFVGGTLFNKYSIIYTLYPLRELCPKDEEQTSEVYQVMAICLIPSCKEMFKDDRSMKGETTVNLYFTRMHYE